MATDTPQENKSGTHTKKNRKIVRLFILAILTVVFWQIAIPAWAIWGIWKKAPWQKNRKILATIVVVVLSAFGISAFTDRNEKPVIKVSEPTGLIQTTDTVIKGQVQPSGSKLNVGGQDVRVAEDGSFSATVPLPSEVNEFVLEAVHGIGRSSTTISVRRALTENEKKAVKEKRVQELTAQLKTAISNVEQYDGSAYHGSVVEIQTQVSIFSTLAKLAKETAQDEDVGIRTLSRDLSAKLSRMQVREFPILRKAWADLVKEKVWEHDVTVKTFGTGHTTLDLTGYYFVTNGNIKVIQESIAEMLQLLRFDQVNYRWYASEDTYTYFKIESLSDGALE